MAWLLETGGLLDVLAKAALILLAAFAAAYLLRRASAAIRYQLWTVALVSVLALPLLSALLPAWQVPLLPVDALEAGLAAAPAAAPPTAPVAPVRQGDGRNEIASSPAAAEAVSPPREASNGALRGTPVSWSSLPAPVTAFLASLSWSTWLAAIWLAGTLFLLARLAVSTTAAWWITRHAEPLRGSRWAVTARAVQDRLGITSEVALVTSDKTTMPMAWGLLRPRVLLPREAEDWPNERRRVVLLHEMAHLKRRDCQTLLLARLVTALYWVNPLAWVANRQMHAERERACDDLVLSAGTRGTDYAQHLLEIAGAMRRPTTAGYAAVAMARPSQLEGRLLRILDPTLNRRRATRMASVAGVVLVSMLVLPLAALQPWAEAAVLSPALDAEEQQRERAQDRDRQVQVETDVQIGNVQARIVIDDLAIDRQIIISLIESHVPQERLNAWAANAAQHIDVREMVAAIIEAARQAGFRGHLRNAFDGAGTDEEQLRRIIQDAMESIDENEIQLAIETGIERFVEQDLSFSLETSQRQADPRVLEALLTALGDTEWQIREQAAESLGSLEDPAGVPALSSVLAGDESARVREAAARALGMIEDASAVAALSTASGDEADAVRKQVAWALGMIEADAGITALSALVTDANVGVRKEAVWALGMIEDQSSVPALTTALGDESVQVRKEAAWALGMIEDPSAVPALTTALGDDRSEVRKEAAWALGMIGDEQALDALLDAMSDENLQVRKQALWAVSQISGDANDE